jgi:hypothetical protein
MRSFESDELKAKEKKEHIMAGHPVLSKCRPTTSSTEHQILDQCKTERTENFFKCCEGYTLNNRR